MKRLTTTAALVLLAASAAFAGDDSGKSCDAPLDDCVREMVAKLRTRGWVGIELDATGPEGFLIKHVVSGSPGEAAGLQPGDRVVAVDGIPYRRENKPRLQEIYEAMVPGRRLTYTVERNDTRVDLPITLGEVPEDLIERWVGEHVLHHHQEEKVAQQGPGRD